MISEQIKPVILHETRRASEMRYNSTKTSKLSEVQTLMPATSHQIMIALHEENPTLSLAKQGLYEEENWGTIFHPENKNWIGYIAPAIKKGNGAYEISRKVVEDAIFLLGLNQQ